MVATDNTSAEVAQRAVSAVAASAKGKLQLGHKAQKYYRNIFNLYENMQYILQYFQISAKELNKLTIYHFYAFSDISMMQKIEENAIK